MTLYLIPLIFAIRSLLWKKKSIREGVYILEPSGVTSSGTAICNVNFELLKEANDLAQNISSDSINVSEDVEDILIKKWVDRYAWDLSEEEIKQTDILKRMGLEEGNYARW